MWKFFIHRGKMEEEDNSTRVRVSMRSRFLKFRNPTFKNEQVPKVKDDQGQAPCTSGEGTEQSGGFAESGKRTTSTGIKIQSSRFGKSKDFITFAMRKCFPFCFKKDTEEEVESTKVDDHTIRSSAPEADTMRRSLSTSRLGSASPPPIVFRNSISLLVIRSRSELRHHEQDAQKNPQKYVQNDRQQYPQHNAVNDPEQKKKNEAVKEPKEDAEAEDPDGSQISLLSQLAELNAEKQDFVVNPVPKPRRIFFTVPNFENDQEFEEKEQGLLHEEMSSEFRIFSRENVSFCPSPEQRPANWFQELRAQFEKMPMRSPEDFLNAKQYTDPDNKE